MKEMSIEEQKTAILQILIDFDRLCKAENIKYTLAYGTLLGAVRHKGFIPWDDDIDVIVKREDYLKITKMASSYLESNHKFICVENNKGFSAPLGKIIDTTTVLVQQGHYTDKTDLGVYIDVFAYDWIPNNMSKQNKVLSKAVKLQRIRSFCGNNYGEHSSLVVVIRSILNRTPLARIVSKYINRWAQSITNDRQIMAALVFGLPKHREKNVMSYNDFQDQIQYTFEGYQFNGIRKADYYLRQWYGDYMKLPPIEAQVSNHSFTVFKKEDCKNGRN